MMQLERELAADCVRFLHTIRRYLCEECDVLSRKDANPDTRNTVQSPVDEQTYLNVFRSDTLLGARAQLIAECEELLARLESNDGRVGKVTESNETDESRLEPDEEESSYIDMSGANTLKASTTSSTNVSVVEEGKQDQRTETDEPNDEDNEEVLFDTVEENSYELTTDQILYDECVQEVNYEEQEQPPPPLTPAPRTPTPENVLPDSQCPYGGLPASHLRLQQSPKHGTLFRQEKRLFFDQFKKYYVGLIGKWLLVYNSHNDLKPLQTIFIKSIKLDLNLNEQINEKHLFQIITHTDSKVHFLSPSFQDLNEWIVAIENNLIERIDRSVGEESAAMPVNRKLPLPPCPVGAMVVSDSKDETDLLTASHVEDGIYEEPSVCLKTDTDTKAKVHGYDTPKPCCGKSVDSVTTGTGGGICSKQNAPNSSVISKKPELPAKTSGDSGGASTPTPVKSWLKNRFNRSPPETGETKLSKKALKKLSFEELSSSDGSPEAKSPAKPESTPSSPKFTLPTTPTSKGTKINMIISQLEANGQLNLLSKRLNDTNKRYTWVADGVTG